MLVAVPLVGIAIVLWRVIPEDHARHITPSQALRVFDHHLRQRSGFANGGNWSELGVYRYATRGGEEIDALLDKSHDYDGLSTVTLWPGECGLVERWQVLAARWSETETCHAPSGREETHSLREFHEFFDVSQEDAFECDGPSTLSVARHEPTRPVTSVCRSPATEVTSTIEVVGVRRTAVGGEAVTAVYMEGESKARGESTGAAKFSEWRRRRDGLLLRREVRGVVDSEANGGFGYREGYTLQLISLTPER